MNTARIGRRRRRPVVTGDFFHLNRSADFLPFASTILVLFG